MGLPALRGAAVPATVEHQLRPVGTPRPSPARLFVVAARVEVVAVRWSLRMPAPRQAPPARFRLAETDTRCGGLVDVYA